MLCDFGSPFQCVSFTVREGETRERAREREREREEEEGGGEEKDCRDGGQGQEAGESDWVEYSVLTEGEKARPFNRSDQSDQPVQSSGSGTLTRL